MSEQNPLMPTLEPEADLLPTQQGPDRVQAVAAVMILGLIGGFAAMVANVWVFWREGLWQMLFVSVGIALAWFFLIYAYQQARSGHLDRAGYLTLAGVFVGLGIGESVHTGLTVALGLSGFFGILLVGAMTLPRRWGIWSLFAILYAAYFWIINRFEPLPRLNVAEYASFQLAVISIVSALLILLVWQFLRLYRFGTIRARLLGTFVILVLVPALAVGTISNALSASRASNQALAQLDTVAALKQGEVQAWADSLITNLLLSMPTIDQLPNTSVLLAEVEYVNSSDYQRIANAERNRLELIITRGRVFDELFLVDTHGFVVLSTDITREGLNEYGYPYFEGGLAGPFVSPQYLSQQLQQRIIVVAAPVTSSEAQVLGLLAGRVNLNRLADLLTLPVASVALGDTGEAYLVARRDLRLLTTSRYPDFTAGETYPLFSEGIQRAASGSNGRGSYTNYAGVLVFGAFRYLPEIDMLLLAEQTRTEALASINQSIVLNIAVTLLIILIAILGALFVTNRITNPIAGLARTAERITTGEVDLSSQPPYLAQRDEIGGLARSFFAMTSRLRHTLEGLEEQVDSRTAALAQRTAYLQAAAEVSQAAATLLDPDELIRQVVDLIRDRFNLYYVGLFLLDEPGEWAVLRAGTGEAGQEMLGRQHRIRVGTGMIGWCVANQQSRIALRAELDEARLVNPFLPLTRSEAAIPLRSRGRVIGALTVQSDQPDAFDTATVAVFETMADQLGVALDNARLFAESQTAFDALSRAYGEQTRRGWSRRLASGQSLGYLADSQGILQPITTPLSEMSQVSNEFQQSDMVLTTPSTASSSDHYLGVPVKLRDQVIGVLQCYKPAEGPSWSDIEIDFIKDVANLLSLTLENARLYEDTQRRAESERLITGVSSRIRQSLDVDTVMQTAVIELQRALGLKDITIRLEESNG